MWRQAQHISQGIAHLAENETISSKDLPTLSFSQLKFVNIVFCCSSKSRDFKGREKNTEGTYKKCCQPGFVPAGSSTCKALKTASPVNPNTRRAPNYHYTIHWSILSWKHLTSKIHKARTSKPHQKKTDFRDVSAGPPNIVDIHALEEMNMRLM